MSVAERTVADFTVGEYLDTDWGRFHVVGRTPTCDGDGSAIIALRKELWDVDLSLRIDAEGRPFVASLQDFRATAKQIEEAVGRAGPWPPKDYAQTATD